jgi:hypothetical protein
MGEGHPGHGFRLSLRPRVHGENPAPRMARHSSAISACSQTSVAAGRRTGRVFPRRRSATDRVRLAQRNPPRTRCAGGFRATLADRTVATVPDSRPRYPHCRAATHARLLEGLPRKPWIALQQDVHPNFDGSLGGAHEAAQRRRWSTCRVWETEDRCRAVACAHRKLLEAGDSGGNRSAGITGRALTFPRGGCESTANFCHRIAIASTEGTHERGTSARYRAGSRQRGSKSSNKPCRAVIPSSWCPRPVSGGTGNNETRLPRCVLRRPV